MGIEGPHMGEAVPVAPAVVPADWVEVSSPSPGNSRGSWELREAVLIPLVPPPGSDAVADPLTVEAVVLGADPFVVPDGDAVEGVERVEVGTLRGSVPLPVST